MNKDHGKNYDSKNLSHCIRILDMGIEIGKYGNIIVRRPEDHIKLLMSIRRGELEYENILSIAENKIIMLDKIYEESDLPNKVNKKNVNDLLIKIRKNKYINI